MSEVNAAYEKADLTTLMRLQMQVTQVDPLASSRMAEDKLQAMCALLKEQVTALEDDLDQMQHRLSRELCIAVRADADEAAMTHALQRMQADHRHEVESLEADLRRIVQEAELKRWLKEQAQRAGSAGQRKSPSGTCGLVGLSARPGKAWAACSDDFLVSRFVQQAVQIGQVGQAGLEEPALAQRVRIGQRRIGAQGFVDLDDFAASGHVHIGCGFDRLDHTGHGLGIKGGTDGGQVHKNNVAQGVLCVDGDAHGGDVAIALQPGVFVGKKEGHVRLGWGLESRNAPKGVWFFSIIGSLT